jgi:tol-pal system protein YbgF
MAAMTPRPAARRWFAPRAALSALLSAACVLSGCVTDPANDPTQVKLNDIDARLGNVERVVSNQSLVDLSRRIDALEAQLREQRGEIEVLQNDAEVARKSGRDLYADLDKRLAALEGGGRGGAATAEGGGGSTGAVGAAGAAAGAAAAVAGGAAAAGGGAAGGGAAAGDAQSAYNASFEKLKAGNYAGAITSFQAFMKNYPASDLNDNAQYWIGEAYYVTRDYDHAAQAFRAVGERWPNSRKAPDALLKLGYTQFEQKHLTDARATLKQVVERYPGGDAARLAQERLQRLPPEAH